MENQSEIFTDELLDRALLFRTLGHPARIAILEYILKSKGCVPNKLSESLDIPQPTVSQHLKALKSVGLILRQLEGKEVSYRANHATCKNVKEYFNHLFS
ncbi:metalloregulator ArsR/SmtB family transcription factor [uncultured Flavobacterium sp.]|uniref:ArsR/SmtB family transcription factor n=1 Tax=uncultured Flavobacterium sp. TaxID=165435 RepID=UPI0025CEB3C1|nr:metalloregulator ArsR/SmtB family transcription factor [uncultured Flavobacterium sp.]